MKCGRYLPQPGSFGKLMMIMFEREAKALATPLRVEFSKIAYRSEKVILRHRTS